MTPHEWEDANRRYLHARIALLTHRLMAFVAARDGGDVPPAPEAVEVSFDSPPALERIRDGFGLSPFEVDVLVLCAGAEIDANVRALCSLVEGSQQRAFPTFNVALAALPEAHWSAIHPAAALRHWKLIELRGDGVLSAQLQLDERVLHYLFGLSYRDARLSGLLVEAPAAGDLVPSHEAVVQRVLTTLARSEDLPSSAVLSLCGDERLALLGIASAAAAQIGVRLQILRAADIPAHAAERETLARLCEREAVLDRTALLIDATAGSEHAANVAAFVDSLAGVAFVAGRDAIAPARRGAVRFDVARPTASEQRALWREALGEDAADAEAEIEQLAAHFTLPLSTIRAVAAQYLAGAPASSPAEQAASRRGARDGSETLPAQPAGRRRSLWDLARIESRMRLDSLAQRIEPAAEWQDLVLPEPQVRILRDIAAHVRQRHRVYEQWGFSARTQRDLGITALFAGSSGTGKTLSAEILANELRLDLYRIDLSQMVSKYIGETEKNLSRIFDAGEEAGAVLLFDEADALFGRRSEVRDSHDRYANLEVSYLLQRMEAYRGLAILTTNLKNALDPAFLRRIRFVVNFPFPDAEQRARIWERVFPLDAPRENLDVQKLARLNIAGGNIRNIAVHAAFLAAEEGGPIRMRHLARAAHGEYAKLEKPLTEVLGGWT